LSAFPSLVETTARIPRPVWHALRAVSVAVAVTLVVLLAIRPTTGLHVFWRIVIPSLPILFFLAPGLWRNICPLAAANQVPRLFGFTRGIALPHWLERRGYLIAVTLLFVLVAARRPLFNGTGWASAILLAAALLGAFAGGLAFKGKSGWCTSICPLLPVQRLYGQTPFAVVRNSHCEPCIGCSTNCFDFNPHVAQIADLEDEQRAPYRRLFAGAFPGLVAGFFTGGSSVASSYEHVAVGALVSLGAFMALDALLHPPPALLTALFGAAALNLFYRYALHAGAATVPLRLLLAAATIVWLVRTARKEARVAAYGETDSPARLEARAAATLERGASGLAEVTVAGRRLAVEPGTTLLEIAERHGVPIESGCRMGMCGMDPVCVVSGADNLSPVTVAERTTLERLGLGDSARLACCARVRGPVELTLDLDGAGAPKPAAPVVPVDPAIRRVVVIGNGIAGVTAADHVRRNHPDCEIALVGRERHNLYNRMAITRLIYGRLGMQGLYLLPDAWYEENRIDCWLNTHVESIDRERGSVLLATDQELLYDRLIITAGSSNRLPPITGSDLPGTFVLRTADDAMEVRDHVQRHHVRRAVVAGGGLLGLEAAYALHKLGARVTVAERGPFVLRRQLDAFGGRYLQDYLEGLGIEFALDATVLAVAGEGHAERVELSDGQTLPCDLLIVAAGIVPNNELAAAAGLAVDTGVVVDERMATSDPRVFAAGDVAERDGKVWGLWPTAVEQARVAAVNALGGDECYEETSPVTMLKVSGVDLTSVGGIVQEPDDVVVALADEPGRRYRKLVLRDNRIVGAILLGYPAESPGVVAAVQDGRDVSGVLDELRQGDWSVLGTEPVAA
jgi:NADPH-dependent 2,4-dienoyl-CoA reductase/sulfur reductase-like enzyme/ferredoxin